MSVYPCHGELQRVLTQSWVSDWDGWTEASAMIDSALISHDENLVAQTFVVRFSRISMDNADLRLCDQDRQRVLLSEGLQVGKGEAHGISNSFLAEYLLQLLTCHDAMSNGLFDTANAEKLWRRDACLAVRAQLCNHEDMTLHPRLRDHTSAIVQDASAEDHTLAYLEHHRHGVAIVMFS